MKSIRFAAPDEKSAVFLPISLNEKITIAINAIAVALSTTLSVFAEGLWFLTTDVLSGGLGMSLTGTLATGVITGVAAVSAIAAIPIAFITYRELNEAEELHAKFLKEKEESEKQRDKILFELLRLRCFAKDELDFSVQVQQTLKDQDEAIEVKKIIQQVNAVYANLSNTRHAIFAENSQLKMYKTANPSAHTFMSLIANPNKAVRGAIISAIKQCEIDFDQSFKEIPKPKNKISGIAIGYGVITGMNAFAFGLSTGWAFGALVIGAGAAAAIPVAGWALLAIGSMAMGIVLGVSMGICKQRNVCRNQVNQAFVERNKTLKQVKKIIQQKTDCCALQPQLISRLSPQVDYRNRVSPLRAHGLLAKTVNDDMSLYRAVISNGDVPRVRRLSM